MSEPLAEEITNPIPRASIINRSAVKNFALKVSKEKRAGKFTRVSVEFLDSVEAEVEALIRGVAQGYDSEVVLPDGDSARFINGKAVNNIEEKLNFAAMKIVQGKVRRHPSLGVTLK